MIRLYPYVLFEITAEIHYTYTWLKREIRLPLLPLVFLLLQTPYLLLVVQAYLVVALDEATQLM